MWKKVRAGLSGLKYRYKLMLFCIVLILVPVMLITAIYLQQVTSIILRESTNDAVVELGKVRDTLANDFMSVEEFSNQIYFNNTISKKLLDQYENKGESADVYLDLINPMIPQNQYFNKTFINDIIIYIENPTFLTNGKNIVFADQTIRQCAWYIDCLQRGKQGNIMWSRSPVQNTSAPGEYTYSLYRCLNNYLGRNAGVLEIQIKESYIQAILQNNNKRELLVLNGDGVILSTNNRELIGKTSQEAKFLTGMGSGRQGQYEVTIGPDRYKVLFDTIPSNDMGSSWKIVSLVPLSYLLQDVNNAKRTGIILSVAALAALVSVIILFSSSLTRRINHLAEKADMVIRGDFHIKVDVEGNDEIGQLGISFNKMLTYMDNLVNEVYENKIKVQDYQIRQKEIELVALQSKINPHFLYNTLDAIRIHALIAGNEQIGDMLVDLSSLLRYSISNKEEIVSVSDEVDHVASYISLMRIRFEDQLHLHMAIDEDVKHCRVLKFILQPIAENAIQHGIRRKNNRGTVSLTAQRQEGDLLIIVTDDGAGMTQEQLYGLNERLRASTSGEDQGKRGIGLSNVNDRMRLFYGEGYGIHVESRRGEGTQVTLRLPFLQEGANHDQSHAG